MVTFTKATKRQAKLRMAIDGPAGSGKTYTALVAATALKNGGRVALIDTERGSAAKYGDLFDFDTLDMREAYPRETFDPANYIEALRAAEAAGYDVIIVDSISPEWDGDGGILQKHDAATKRNSGNGFVAWKDVNTYHDKFVSAMLDCRCHLIVTMRSKMDHQQTKDDRGKNVVEKLGMAPIQRNGVEYEFDVVGDMNQANDLIISKTRCHLIAGAVVSKPDGKWFQILKSWLSDGAPAVERIETTTTTTETTEQPAPNAWTRTTGQIDKMAEHYALTNATVLEALGVDELMKYQGTKADAKVAIERWLRDNVPPKSEPEPETLAM